MKQKFSIRKSSPVVWIALVVAAAVGVAGLAAFGSATSIVTDLGYSEAQFDRALEKHGAWGAARLEELGFPHATGNVVEVYELQQDGEPELTLVVDWQNGTISRGDGLAPTAVVNLNPEAYAGLLRQIAGVLSGSPIEYNWAARWLAARTWDATVDVEGKTDFEDGLYKARVLAWVTSTGLKGAVTN